jgi:hypothetical protein
MATGRLYRFAFLPLAVAGCLPAQQIALPAVQLSGSETRFLSVPAGNPDVRTTFNLETSTPGQGSFLVSSSDPGSVISLVAANGTEITTQNASANGYMFDVLAPNSINASPLFSPLFPTVLNVRITVYRGASGQIQVKVNNSAVGSQSGVLVTYYPMSSLRIALAPNKPAFVSGEGVALSLLIFDGSTPVSAAQAALRIQRSADPSAAVYSVACVDFGPLDAAVGDGIYTCMIDGLPSGDYVAAARVIGTAGIVRTVSSSFRVIPAYGSIVASTDEGVDRNGNGLIEAIRLNVSLNIAVAGNYRLLVRLQGSNANQVQQALDSALSQGQKVLSVDFPARLISGIGVDGAYAIENCTLLFKGAQVNDVAATRQDLGQTKAYTLRTLELAPRPTLRGDLNADGLVNCVDIGMIRASFGKTAAQPGFNPKADVNGDGVVDVRDLALVSMQLTSDTHCGN